MKIVLAVSAAWPRFRLCCGVNPAGIKKAGKLSSYLIKRIFRLG